MFYYIIGNLDYGHEQFYWTHIPTDQLIHNLIFHFYLVDNEQNHKNGKLDYDVILKLAKEEKPNLLLAGYSAYPYAIDFKKLKEIFGLLKIIYQKITSPLEVSKYGSFV